MNKIRTRFAPSPTGDPHIGHLRTCAYSYALSKHEGGDFILRIEDTDQRRYKPESVEILKKMVMDFGMKWDEYYVQSERAKAKIYIKAAEKLVEEGHAFYCDCGARNAKEEGYSSELRDPCRDKGLKSGAIKLKIPDNDEVTYHDYVLDKEITWDTNTVADTTLLKSQELDRLPTYHLAVVVDDNDMRITHALRGHDWMPSTPVHLLVYKFLGYEVPEIGHLTDIQSLEGGKLSKRRGSTSIQQLLSEGYLKEAIFNFTILLGWAPKDNRELFTLDQFVENFDSDGFQKANPIFNRDKLDWFNQQYIQKLSKHEFVSHVSNASVYHNEPNFNEIVSGTASFMPSRMTTLKDYDETAGFFFKWPKPDDFSPSSINHLVDAKSTLEKVDDWDKEHIDKVLLGLIAQRGYKTGDFFMDLRVAITGSKYTPPITDSIAILGKEETLKRLENFTG